MNDEVFPINVNYTLPLTDMIHAGNYDAVHCSPLHDGHQPPTRNGIEIVSIELLSFDRNYELAAMVAEIDRRGFRSANLYEFLALGAQYPDLQRQSWLVTLGAAEKRSYARFWSAMNAGEDALIPCLFTTLGERTLLSAAFDGHYRPGFSFACVRKRNSEPDRDKMSASFSQCSPPSENQTDRPSPHIWNQNETGLSYALIATRR